jgi:alpha-mannosidase II
VAQLIFAYTISKNFLPNLSNITYLSFLQSGQLEILTGGWVMTDEANSRSFSIVMELIEGHEFLLNQLNYRPKSHWSIDPFGLSPTLAQFVKSANFTQMAINRVHYSVKKYLAKTKQLEFRWRQLYAKGPETDIRTHMLPFQGLVLFNNIVI